MKYLMIYSLTLLLFTSCITRIPEALRVKIEAKYSKAADTFDIMDNVSNWWPGFTEPEYQKEWVRRFGQLKEEDQNYINQYIELRQRYYELDENLESPRTNRNGLFSTLGALNADPVAKAFYSSDKIEEAYQKLIPVLYKDELDFLKKFYSHFSSRYKKLLAESESNFPKAIVDMNDSLNKKGMSIFFSRIARFFKLEDFVRYHIRYVWWPPISRTQANPTANFLIMRYNPIVHLTENHSDIAAHEVIHAISASQSLTQKGELTKSFLDKCEADKSVDKFKILENPLAVIFGQMLFEKYFYPEKFDLSKDHIRDPWVNTMARSSYLIVKKDFEEKKLISPKLMSSLGKICADLLKAEKSIKKPVVSPKE